MLFPIAGFLRNKLALLQFFMAIDRQVLQFRAKRIYTRRISLVITVCNNGFKVNTLLRDLSSGREITYFVDTVQGNTYLDSI